jgi:uncharacterized protein
MLEDLFQLSQRIIINNLKEYKRYFLKNNPFNNRFSILIGQRGIGKTTAIIQYLNHYSGNNFFSKKILYVPSDHYLVKRKSLYEIAEEFQQSGGELLCLDEIHKYADWSRELKSIYDTFNELKIIATGSSILEISKGSHDLSRRAIIYRMYGMSFREFLEIKLNINLKTQSLENIYLNHQEISKDIIKLLKKKKASVLGLFGDYLSYGYYPFFLDYDNTDQYLIALDQSIHTTLENDLISIYPSLSGHSIKKISQLLAVIAEEIPFIPDMRRLKNILDIGDERTLKLYLKYLEEAGVIHMLFRSGSRLKQMEKPEKIYLNNTNLMNAISFAGNINTGSARETFFISMLKCFNKVNYSESGDFIINNKYVFEIGGKNKSFKQIRNLEYSYLALDNIEIGIGNKIPLYLFGFLY